MKFKQGFTLIELILYMAIVSIVTGAMITFAWRIILTGAKSSVQQEVSSNGRLISERIKYEIRNSFGINSMTSSQIVLCKNSAACGTNPTTITYSPPNVTIQNNGAAAVNLNSEDVLVSGLTFNNYSSTDLKSQNVQFGFVTYALANYCIPGDASTCRAPIGEWNFEEGSGGTVFDTSGNNKYGNLAGSPNPTWSTSGYLGSALQFTGVAGQLVNLGDNPAFELTNFTIVAWIYRTGTCTFGFCTIMAKGNSGAVGFALDVTTEGGAVYRPRLDIRDVQKVYGTTTINLNQWYHVAATVDGSNVKVYTNGALEAQPAQTSIPTYSTEFATIGTNNGTNNLTMNGRIDQLRFFDYARTSAQIAWDYAQARQEYQGSISTEATAEVRSNPN